MLTEERRPMTGMERQRVQEALSGVIRQMGWASRLAALLTGLGCGFVLSGFLIFLALAAWGWLANLFHRPGLSPTTDTCLTICLVGALLGAILSTWMEYQNHSKARRIADSVRQEYQRDLEAGEAEVWHCDVSRVVALDEQDDEGPSFFLELAPRQALFLYSAFFCDLMGDEYGMEDEEEPAKPPYEDPGVWPPPPRLVSPPDKRTFPCRRFDLVYAPNSRLLLDLVCLGERFEEWPTYSPDLERYVKMSLYPKSGDILPVSLDSLDIDLARWAAGQERSKQN